MNGDYQIIKIEKNEGCVGVGWEILRNGACLDPVLEISNCMKAVSETSTACLFCRSRSYLDLGNCYPCIDKCSSCDRNGCLQC